MWKSFRTVIMRAEDEGRTLSFWLRDDDAVQPGRALDRLIAASQRYGVPAALAVIPRRAEPALAARLAGETLVTPLVHGWSHANHAPSREKKQEFGPHRTHEVMKDELAKALSRMKALFAGNLANVLVPPWNRIDPALIPHLPGLGYQAVSLFGTAASGAPLPVINTHIDPIDWRGTRGCRDETAIVSDLIRLFASAPRPRTAGLLLHHLVHDDAVWRFLDRLFEETARSPCCRWLTIAELLEDKA